MKVCDGVPVWYSSAFRAFLTCTSLLSSPWKLLLLKKASASSMKTNNPFRDLAAHRNSPCNCDTASSPMCVCVLVCVSVCVCVCVLVSVLVYVLCYVLCVCVFW
jgi:hypothetical protein